LMKAMGYDHPGPYRIAQTYLMILPDHYPDPQFTLEQRSRGIRSYAAAEVYRGIEKLQPQHPDAHFQLYVQVGSQGQFTLELVDQWRHFEQGKDVTRWLKTQIEPYLDVLNAGANAVSGKLPAGSRIDTLDTYAGPGSDGRHLIDAVYIYLVAIALGLIALCAYLGVRFSEVVDLDAAAAVFPGETKYLQIPKYPDLGRLLNDNRPPNQCRLLAEFLLHQHAHGRRSIAITSPVGFEGKTTLALFLAGILPQHAQTHLYDADGTQQASERFTALRRLSKWATTAVHFKSMPPLSDANIAENAARLVASSPTAAIHLFDCSPILAADPSLALVKNADISILVVEEVRYRATFREAVEAMKFFDIRPDIVIINKAAQLPFYYGYPYVEES
jgi:hypothetical protein